MSKQSNIILKSNIYINKTKSQFDKDFIKHVRGYDTLYQLKQKLGVMQDQLLTPVQQAEIDRGTPKCYLDKTGDTSWGVILKNGQEEFVCKCEYTECQGFGRNKGYVECSSYQNFRKINRK